jgi:hypothetical protein
MYLVKRISSFERTDNETNECFAPFTALHASRFTNDESYA